MYKVKLPKIMFLALDISHHYKKKRYYNTNDLATLANQLSQDLVRKRADKTDYKYLEDTKFGGLRGNFSTLLTFRGLVRRGSGIIPYYSIGPDERLINAVGKGEIILDRSELTAHTNNENLRKRLETEARLLTVREKQAHIKVFLDDNPDYKLKRDEINFPKESVVKSADDVYFLRALFNNYNDLNCRVAEYSLIRYWSGTKFSRLNMHVMLAIPDSDDPWSEVYGVCSEDLLVHKPLFLYIDVKARKCYDLRGNIYQLVPIEDARTQFSKSNANIQERLNYEWPKLRDSLCEEEAPEGMVRDDEFSMFLGHFLGWQKDFVIDGKQVVDMQVSASGGADVRLKYKGGTTQKVELEHKWSNYILHGHYKTSSFANCWLFSEQEWSPSLIIKLFSDLKKEHGQRVPDVFLCVQDGKKKAYRANWVSHTFEELEVN